MTPSGIFRDTANRDQNPHNWSRTADEEDIAHGWAVYTQDGTIVIVLTRLSGTQFALNPDLLARIECTPDTVLVMLDGSQYLVKETMEQVVDAVMEYRAAIVARALSSDGLAFAHLDETRPPVLRPVTTESEDVS